MRCSTIGGLLAIALIAGCASDGGAERAGVECEDQDCFSEQVAQCQAAQYTTEQAAGAVARYTVEGPTADGCRIQLRYTENPNPAWVDQPLTFVVDPDEAFEPQLKAAVSSCLAGEQGHYRCEGPLFEAVGGAPAGTARTASTPPCGKAVEVDEEPLYALPRDGKWGYVNRTGEWVIDPQWRQAEPFSEGRAAVETGGRWGIIDRDGNYMLEPSLRAQTFQTVDGERIGDAPVRPYATGCAAVVGETASDPPYFIDRQGRFWLRNGLPEALLGEDVREFGSFSEGKAWFRIYRSGLTDDYGWIDTTGSVVIAPEFVGGGAFVDGLAPAATDRDNWGFIDEAGELALLGKWTLRSARAFSEGRAFVDIGTYDWAYMDREGDVVDRIRFDRPRTVTTGQGTETHTEAEIQEGGGFHDGLAPVIPALPGQNELVYIKPDGAVAFVPGDIEGIAVCNVRSLPEFRNGLVRLLIANDSEDCGEGAHSAGLPSYDRAHYVYLDTSGDVVLEQPESEASTAAD